MTAGFLVIQKRAVSKDFRQSPLERILPERKGRTGNDFIFFMFITTGSQQASFAALLPLKCCFYDSACPCKISN